eukprot:IDg19557t1
MVRPEFILYDIKQLYFPAAMCALVRQQFDYDRVFATYFQLLTLKRLYAIRKLASCTGTCASGRAPWAAPD